jgi:hypothetical protein
MKLRALAVGLPALVAASAIGVALVTRPTSSGQQRHVTAQSSSLGGNATESASRGDGAGVTLSHPLLAAQQVPPADASSAAGYNVPEATTTVAGPANLTSVYVNKLSQQVALVYGNGDVTVVMSPAGYSDPTIEYTEYLSSNNATASLASVNGTPALVISPDTDIKQSNPAWVEFDLQGIDINVESATESTSTLLSVAQNLYANGCSSCASSARAPTARRRVRSASIVGTVLTCSSAHSTRCARATQANVLVLDSDGRAIARANVLHGAFRFALRAGRYGLIATPPAAAPIRGRSLHVQWLTLGAGSAHKVIIRSDTGH